MSITAIGTDIVDVRRLQAATERKGNALLARLFTVEEQHYADAAKTPERRWLRYGNRYAAKEACFKVLGARGKGIGWQDIAVTHQESGAPTLILSTKADAAANALLPAHHASNYHLHLSLSDEYPYALAFVTLSAA